MDLEIESRVSLERLSADFGERVHVLYCGKVGRGRQLLAVEIAGFPRTPDAAILGLCVAVKHISPEGRQLWRSAIRRRFDVGFELKHGERAATFALELGTIKRAASIQASIAATVYREDNSEPVGRENAG